MVAEVVCCDATALSRRARPLKRAWTPAVGGRLMGVIYRNDLDRMLEAANDWRLEEVAKPICAC